MCEMMGWCFVFDALIKEYYITELDFEVRTLASALLSQFTHFLIQFQAAKKKMELNHEGTVQHEYSVQLSLTQSVRERSEYRNVIISCIHSRGDDLCVR